MDSDSTHALALSIIVPALNEAAAIGSTLAGLRNLDSDGLEIIVVDGGSADRTAEIARRYADQVLIESRGRAIQMNRGAEQARGTYLLFLHADTRVPPDAFEVLCRCLRRNCVWGRFDIRLSGPNAPFRVVEFCINLRSRLTGIATGDQGIFVKRTIFQTLGGFPEIPIMEDIALSKILKNIAAPVCLRQALTTSSRRWEQDGMLRTILLMWSLRLFYFFGTDPQELARWYR
ncbi:MAG: TIGR04283 family arsenosugar biosynthesis glycosyltransferase [Methylococcaceae bacterium]|nr:TIGR04283 family arsenosugar biosynthesis glycosyltransferase [Methylococcaceae bacterium]